MKAADRAVAHIVRRVQEDASFSWLMIGTESLALCFAAIAERTGESESIVRDKIERNAASATEVPEIVRLRKRLEGLDKTDPDPDASAENESKLRNAVEELCWAAKCGADVLSVENLERILGGQRVI